MTEEKVTWAPRYSTIFCQDRGERFYTGEEDRFTNHLDLNHRLAFTTDRLPIQSASRGPNFVFVDDIATMDSIDVHWRFLCPVCSEWVKQSRINLGEPRGYWICQDDDCWYNTMEEAQDCCGIKADSTLSIEAESDIPKVPKELVENAAVREFAEASARLAQELQNMVKLGVLQVAADQIRRYTMRMKDDSVVLTNNPSTAIKLRDEQGARVEYIKSSIGADTKTEDVAISSPKLN